jgi:hypothetical protein
VSPSFDESFIPTLPPHKIYVSYFMWMTCGVAPYWKVDFSLFFPTFSFVGYVWCLVCFLWFVSRFHLILISFLISRSCFDFFFLWVKEYSRCLYFVKLAENFLLNILFHSIQAKFMKVRFFGNYLRVQFGMFLVLLSFIIIMLEYVSEFKI